MSNPRAVIRLTSTLAGPLGLVGVVLDADPKINANPPMLLNNGQELQVQSTRSDLDTPLQSQETAQLQVLLRPRIALDANIASLQGLSAYQGVALADGDMLLLFGQTDSTQNGPWMVHANIAGVVQAWTRPAIPFGSGSLLLVQAGSYAQKVLVCVTPGAIAYGATALAFAVVGAVPAGAGAAMPAVITPKAATHVNVTISGPQTVDGTACTAGDLVVLMGQTTGPENGPWVVQAGAWTRPTIPFGPGSLVLPSSGAEWSGQLLVCMNQAPIVYGTTTAVFLQPNMMKLTGTLGRRLGSVTLVAGVGTVTGVTLYSNSVIHHSRQNPAGTVGVSLAVKTADRVNGVLTGSFKVTSVRSDGATETGDTSVVDWTITN